MIDRRASLLLHVVLLGAALGERLCAQQPTTSVPLRALGPISAISKDTLGPRIVARGLSNGSVLVAVFPTAERSNGRRIVLFDSTLQHAQLVMDSTHASEIIPFKGDSTIALDAASRTLLVLDQRGQVVRSMALPHTQDYQQLRGILRSFVDPQGRLVYRTFAPPSAPQTVPNATVKAPRPDSAAIVRADFDSRHVDTVTSVAYGKFAQTWITLDGRNTTFKNVINPVAADDEWTMLDDGTIAVVRALDYHIDWVDPDGTRRSTARMPYDWKRLTESEKQKKLDSLTPLLHAEMLKNPPRTVETPDGPRTVTTHYVALPSDQFPEYEPAISFGSVRADLEGRIWIVPRSSSAAKDGLLYDVVNKLGAIVERVQFPKGTVLVGFGPGDVVYLNRVEGDLGFLEQAKIK